MTRGGISRRDGLKLGAALGGLTLGTAGRATAPAIAVFDSRFAAARRFAIPYAHRRDCAQDSARLWHAALAADVEAGCRLEGLTMAADAAILADYARREGLRFHLLKGEGLLKRWMLEAKR